MSLTDSLAETIYRVATTRSKLKIVLILVGLTFCFGLSVLLVFVSLWMDKFLSVRLLLPVSTNMLLSLPLLVIGSMLSFGTVYSFFRDRGSPAPINPPQKLVTTGLNSWIRNPMILGWIIMLFGVGLLLGPISLIVTFPPLFILLNVLYLKTVEEE